MSHELWRESLKRLRAIAQTGQTYTKDPYDRGALPGDWRPWR